MKFVIIPTIAGLALFLFFQKKSPQTSDVVTIGINTPSEKPKSLLMPQKNNMITIEVQKLFKLGRFQEALDLIHSEIQSGNPDITWLKRQLNPVLISLGWKKIQEGKCEEAIPILQKVLRSSKDPLALKGLGTCHFLRKDYWTASNYFESYLEKNFSFDVIMTQIQGLESMGRFDDIILLLEKAVNEQNLTQDQRHLIDEQLKISLEKRSESDYQAYIEGHYVNLSYRAIDHEELGIWALETLDVAVEEISNLLNLPPPKNPIDVFLYPMEGFHKLHHGPKWAQGVFDGKVRIPIPHHLGSNNLDRLSRTLRHEITHALVNFEQNNHLPTWFQEGLAQILECPNLCNDFSFPAQRGLFLPQEILKKPFLTLGQQEARIAYLQSLYLLKTLVHIKGKESLGRIVKGKNSSSLRAIDFDFDSLYRVSSQNWQKGISSYN